MSQGLGQRMHTSELAWMEQPSWNLDFHAASLSVTVPKTGSPFLPLLLYHPSSASRYENDLPKAKADIAVVERSLSHGW